MSNPIPDDVGPQQARFWYSRIMARSEALSREAFNTIVEDYFNGLPKVLRSPSMWIRAAKSARFRCGRCAGTGQYITSVVNGKPVGPGGICFRCEGKGAQDDVDVLRNMTHDRFYFGRSVT